MIPNANVAKQFLSAHLEPGQQQLSDTHRKMPPPEDDINMFREVTGGFATRDTAIRFIDGAAGNIENAMNDYWTNPDKYDVGYQGYDESQFHADREGNVGAGIPSFTIDAGDDGGGGASGFLPTGSSAPTRPPSRRSNYSTRSGQQENGVVNSLGQDQGGRTYFGPLTRDAASYAPEQWALVTTSSAARVYDNPEDPKERRRDWEKGEPVFFRPLKEKDPLPSLVAVLGQIPLARRALLGEELGLASYGSNSKWWDGECATAGEASVVDDGMDPHKDVVVEAQRLMAFIQESNRSYGSVEALDKLEGISNITTMQVLQKAGGNYSGELRFLVGWSAAAMIYGSHADIFKTIITASENNGGVMQDKADTIYRLDLEPLASEPKQSLYQAIDELIWMNDPTGEAEDEYFIEQVAPILVMRVTNKDTSKETKGLGLQVPHTFYADRYLKDNSGVMRQMRKDKALLRRHVQNIDLRKAKLNSTPHPKDPTKMLDREELFEKSIEYLRGRDKPPVIKKLPVKKEADEVMEEQEPEMRTPWDDLADQLEREHDKIKNKLKDLDDYRAHLETQMSTLSSILTEHSSNDDVHGLQQQPTTAYTLRGIAIGPAFETTFVYVDHAPSTSPFIDDDTHPEAMDIDSDTTKGQWWRFEFTSNGSWTSPTTKPVSESEVLAEASDGTTEALLIYAAADACDTTSPQNTLTELGGTLGAFIARDNAAFDAELRAYQDSFPVPQGTWNDDDPPPYDAATASTERIEVLEGRGETHVTDLGPGVVSDEEYAVNSQFDDYEGVGGGRVVSTEMRDVGQYDGVDEMGRKDGGYHHW